MSDTLTRLDRIYTSLRNAARDADLTTGEASAMLDVAHALFQLTTAVALRKLYGCEGTSQYRIPTITIN